MKKKVGVLGANGALGSQILWVLKDREEFEVTPVYHYKLRVAGESGGYGPAEMTKIYDGGGDFVELDERCAGRGFSLSDLLDRTKFDVLINTVAFNSTNEADSNPNQAFLLNTIAVYNLARECNERRISLVHISTDYVMGITDVFNISRKPLTEKDTPNPLNVYGISKYAGEQAVMNYSQGIVVRVAALFGKVGSSSKNGMNFVYTILKKIKNNELPIQCINDQWVLPGYTLDVACKIVEIMNNGYPRLYHITNSGNPITWYDFGKEIARYVRSEKFVRGNILPVGSDFFYSTTPRARFTALETEYFEYRMRPWKDALLSFFENELQLNESINIKF